MSFIGPRPYRDVGDSPFNEQGLQMFLETFEDGMLNGPGVSATTGGSVPIGAIFRDSVDADDGVIDGSGSGGRSFHSSMDSAETSRMTFAFDTRVLGRLPTRAGIVWTDVGRTSSSFGEDSLVFEAFDSNGASLGTVGPIAVGDGIVSGETAEDRFIGVAAPAGISGIAVQMAGSTDWEVDHLQYEIGDFAKTQADLAQCHVELSSATVDGDQDGSPDAADTCPDTPAGDAVDGNGCSIEQFCAAMPTTTSRDRRTCLKADWLNDEPLMKRAEADCTLTKGQKPAGSRRCVAR